jgi:Fic family protein
VHALAECLDHFERFLHDDPSRHRPRARCAGACVSETIHPFLDGNGRIGRLLIVLQLVADGLLREPLLYPSLFFKTHQALYYELLNDVRLNGDWERWLEFFAEAITASAAQAVRTAQALLALVSSDRERLVALGRAAPSASAMHQVLQRQPVATAASLGAATGLTAATVNKSLAHLQRIGIVEELTARQRGRVFAYAVCGRCSMPSSTPMPQASASRRSAVCEAPARRAAQSARADTMPPAACSSPFFSQPPSKPRAGKSGVRCSQFSGE